MATNKNKKVTVTHPNEKIGDQHLDLGHAERLLMLSNNGGWKLPKNSPYKLDSNGLTKKRSTGNTTESD